MNNLLSVSKLFLKRNSSTILTCVGAIGVVATTVMAVKATPKAQAVIEAKKEEKGEDLTRLETIAAVAPAYAPSAITGVATIGCIFASNVLNKRQQASLMSAYALIDRSYKDYKKKVDELYGEEAGEQVREEIAKDKYEEANIKKIEDGKELFYDFYSGRYFESTMADVVEAEYKLNQTFIARDYAYLNEFYELLGIEEIDSGYALGWSTVFNQQTYWETWISFEHEKLIIEDDLEQYDADDYRGLECTIIYIKNDPIVGFEDYQ